MSQVAIVGRRELDSRTEVANLKKTLETSGPKTVEANKSSQEFAAEKKALFDKAMKYLISGI